MRVRLALLRLHARADHNVTLTIQGHKLVLGHLLAILPHEVDLVNARVDSDNAVEAELLASGLLAGGLCVPNPRHHLCRPLVGVDDRNLWFNRFANTCDSKGDSSAE